MDIFVTFLMIAGFIAVAVALSRSKNSLRTASSLESQIAALREELRHITKRVYQLEKFREGSSDNRTRDEGAAEEAAKSEAVQATPAPTPANAPMAASIPPRVPAAPTKEPSATQPLLRSPSFTAYSQNAVSKSTKLVNSLKWADIEERLGTNWLNKIGTAAFVIGVALLLNYSMHYLGPRGKIALGYGVSVILLAAGIVGERKERYRIAGRAVLGGGWALVYFTTYAMHNIAAVRIVESSALGFALLFVVAVAMVAHSLRYHSQVTTGFAYLLAFVSVGVGQIPIGGLVATALLAASLAVILRARQWYALEPFAIVATYLLHWMWLNQIYERIGGHKPFPEFTASVALLTAYWVVYLVSYFLRNGTSTEETQLLTASFLLNAAGYLTVLHYESFHPAWRFWFLLAAGAVYLGISAFSRIIDRRVGFILASTLGVALLLAAIPYRYSGGNLEILWLIEAEALLIVGWRLADSHLRNLGWAGAALLAGYAAFHDLTPRFVAWQLPNAKTGWLMVALAAAFYLNGRLRERLGDKASQVDQAASIASPGIATGFALAAAWIGLPFFWPGLVWTLIAVTLLEVGRRFADRMLRICGHTAAALAVLRLLTVNLFHSESWHNVSLRLVTVAASCAVLYLYARRVVSLEEAGNSPSSLRDVLPKWIAGLGGIPALYTGTATLLVAILLWDEVTTAGVAIAWGIFGLALLESARALSDKALRVQAYSLLFASFARIFIADLNSTARMGPIPTPIVTVTLLAAIYYYASTAAEENLQIRSAFLWLGTIAVAALFRFELVAEWVAVSWAALAVLLYALGRWLKSRTLRTQSYAMTLAVGVRCAFDNFYQVGRWHFTTLRVATVVASAALLYVLFAATKLSQLPSSAESEEGEAKSGYWKRLAAMWSLIENHSQHVFFFVPTLLLTVLLSLEVRRGFLTAAWGVEALVIFLAVLKMHERAYRWFSLSLFLLCVARIVTVDVWNLDALGRIVSFLGLGVALLAVSFLYARHREILRKVL